MAFKFTLKETLNKLNLTENKIARESNIRPATVYSICKGEIKRIELDTFIKLLDALNRLSPFKEITVEDVIKYELDRQSQKEKKENNEE